MKIGNLPVLASQLGKLRTIRYQEAKAVMRALVCCGLLALAPSMQAAPIAYSFLFQQNAGEAPLPSGGFTYDDASGLFSAFQVSLDGASYDFTAAANALGGRARLPFELGFLGQNLITGAPNVGYANWWADDTGFRGFEWRTPAQDFLYFDLNLAANPNLGIYSGPNAYSGTWSTQLATPEPGTFGLSVAAGLIFACNRLVALGRGYRRR